MIPDTDFSDDSRGVSEVVGFILIFAILVIVLSINQAQIVPSENKQVEFQHNEEVQGQLQDLRNGILETAGTGSTQPVSIKLGTRFPARTIAVNPPPVSGRIETRAVGTPAAITVDNVEAIDPDTADYWNGTPKNFSTTSIVYEADYRVLTGTPNATVYENTVLYNRFESGATLPLTDQILIDGNVITIITINGSLSESGSGSSTVTPRAISGPYSEIAVRNTASDEPINITIPTSLSKEQLTNITDLSQPNIRAITPIAGSDRITVTLEPGTYNLRMAKVGIGADVRATSDDYITVSEKPPSTLAAGENETITLEVRDEFNNPVPGSMVNVTVAGSGIGSISPTPNGTAGESGEVAFEYAAADAFVGSSYQDDIRFWIGSGSTAKQVAWANITVTKTGGNGTDAAYTLQWNRSRIEASGPYLEYYGGNDTIVYDVSADSDTSFDGWVNTTPAQSFVSVDFSTNNSSVVSNFGNTTIQTGSDGQGKAAITVSQNGKASLLASSMESSDSVILKVIGLGGAGANQSPIANFSYTQTNPNKYDLNAGPSNDPDGTIENFEWYKGADTTGPPDATGETVPGFNPKPYSQITLVVTDDDGATDSITKSV